MLLYVSFYSVTGAHCVLAHGLDAGPQMEKAGDVGEDEMKDGLDAIQKLTDSHVKDIDNIVSDKEKEVMKV